MKKELKHGGARVLTVLLFTLCFSFSLTHTVQAHEAYVLTESQLKSDYAAAGPTAFAALKDPTNLNIAIAAGIGAIILLGLYYAFAFSKVGKRFDKWLSDIQGWDKLILRIALAVALYGSALTATFLGPELPLITLPFTNYLIPVLYGIGTLFLLGLFTELAAAILLVLYVASFVAHGSYMFTYIEYFGLGVLLLFFGAGQRSLDHLWFQRHRHNDHIELETLLLRLTYALSIFYVAVGTKILHPQVIVDIATKYNLMKYSWLFPSDPLLIALGAGLTQVGLATTFLLGAAVRLSALATLGLVTLSVLFFRESVWPHLPLLGIGLYLFLNRGGNLSLDGYLLHHKQKRMS